jgi:peroxiredoxin
MVALSPPLGPFGIAAPDFELKDVVSGHTLRLADVKGDRGTVVMFICNHCPYVKAIVDRIVRDCRELEAHGIKTVAIMANDVDAYPDDAPDKMVEFAKANGFTFPYLYDETQAVARAYGAVCTPDFFGYDAELKLCYRGRFDESRNMPASPKADRELFEAMVSVAETQTVPENQTPSIGCSIKWKHPAE